MSRYFLTAPVANATEKTLKKSSQSHVQIPKLSKSLHSQTMHKSRDALQKGYNPEDIKLPMVSLKKVLNKIGALSNREGSFVPTEDEQKIFRALKIKQLKQFYPFASKKRSGQVFKFQLDQIVLDCYQYGQPHGKKTVWRKYRQNIDSLSFDTMKILNKKKWSAPILPQNYIKQA